MRRSKPTRVGLLAESGFALPTVLFLVLAGFAIASAAVTAALGGQRGTSRDYDTKDALGVAEAGVEQTLERYNLSTTTPPCTTGCTGTLSNGGTYTTWTRLTAHSCPGGPHDVLEVVSQGTADGVTRRVYTQANSASNECPFLDAGVIGLNSIHMDSNASITADVASNGNVVMDANANLIGCAQVGEGYAVTGAGVDGWTCGTGPVYGTTSLPAVNQGDVDINNQNSTLLAHVGGQKASDVCYNGFQADGAATTACGTRELLLNGNATLTLTSGNYSLCRMELLSNSAIYIAAGAIVRIFFDSPEACGYDTGSPGTTQLRLDSNTRITVNGGGTAGNVALLFVGSDDIDTSIVLASNTLAQNACNQDFVVYAPRTDVELRSNSYYCGAIAGKTIEVDSNSAIQTSNNASDFDIDAGGDHYYAEEFRECTGAASAYASPFDRC
jgi:Tfp pilus assembly protein PilX